MRFKLDENLGTRTQQLFRTHEHDAQTARSEGLQGASDQRVYEACRIEQRCLVTLDLDFADVIRFPPDQASGIVVIRIPRNPSLAVLELLVGQFLLALTQMSVGKRLWIIEPGRIRIHETDMDTP